MLIEEFHDLKRQVGEMLHPALTHTGITQANINRNYSVGNDNHTGLSLRGESAQGVGQRQPQGLVATRDGGDGTLLRVAAGLAPADIQLTRKLP